MLIWVFSESEQKGQKEIQMYSLKRKRTLGSLMLYRLIKAYAGKEVVTIYIHAIKVGSDCIGMGGDALGARPLEGEPPNKVQPILGDDLP